VVYFPGPGTPICSLLGCSILAERRSCGHHLVPTLAEAEAFFGTGAEVVGEVIGVGWGAVGQLFGEVILVAIAEGGCSSGEGVLDLVIFIAAM